MSNTATRIRAVHLSADPNASQAIYQLDPPLDGHEHVVVSAATVALCGPETYIFGSDENGKIEDYGELNGSFRGGLNHAKALANAGYEVRNV